MKSIKVGIVGICISLLGIAFALNNFFAIVGAFIGLIFSLAALFLKNS